MKLMSVSISDIQEDVIGYFMHHYGTPRSAFTPATNLKTMYTFNGDAWAQLGDTLSDLPWMSHLGVRLSHADMMTVATVAQLSYLIFTNMQHVVAAPADSQITPVSALMQLSPHKLAKAAPAQPPRPGKKPRQ